MLMNDFYTVVKQESGDGLINATICFNKEHSIFKGHFPGLPIVPGVCMVQLTRELVEQVTTQSLQLTTADSIKFLSVINPEINPEVNIKITYLLQQHEHVVQATISLESTIFFKFKGAFVKHGYN
ncbi:MAG TPA: 3-hydroxyacyl-ACP dehydratase [Cytophagales bacterium]|nr:3-hydroxyacyl-ACP dehydratase [Cytophagales bacterium]